MTRTECLNRLLALGYELDNARAHAFAPEMDMDERESFVLWAESDDREYRLGNRRSADC